MTALKRIVARRSQTVPKLVQKLARADGLVKQLLDEAFGPHVWVRGRRVLNFASTNYLGLGQDPRVLGAVARAPRRWGVSLGVPRLFATDRLTARLETEIANLVGQEAALVFPSTTHVALDVLPLLAGRRGVLFVDERAYPISLEGAHAAVRRGAHIVRFPHNHPGALARLLETHARNADKVIVCDGVYSAGGQPARLREFVRMSRAYDAVVYVDDAHGLGILGSGPTKELPYGQGGGGTPRHFAVPAGNLVHVGSLSKAFGVPIAFVAGPACFIEHLGATAPTFAHSSPPALITVAAALSALKVHADLGDTLRRRLARRVRRFRRGLARAGVNLPPNRLFPIQGVRFSTPHAAASTARALRRRGIWAVLQLNPPDHPTGGVLRFVITAHHTPRDIDQAVTTLSKAISRSESTPARRGGPTRIRRIQSTRY